MNYKKKYLNIKKQYLLNGGSILGPLPQLTLSPLSLEDSYIYIYHKKMLK